MIHLNDSMETKPFLNRNQIFLGLILVAAFTLRIWGIDFGLPHIYHTDEWFEVKRALKLGSGVFDFERVSKGGYFYLLFFEYGIYYVALKLFGVIKSADDFLFKVFQDPTNIWLIGRITTAVIGTLNCLFVYILGKHVHSKTVGLFAALFLAIHLIHVQSSHYITVDVPLTCLITICFLIMCLNISESKFNKFHYCMLAIFVALAVMTKIPGAVILFPVLIFHYRNIKSESSKVSLKSYLFDKRFLYFSLVFLIVYISGNPGIIIKLKSTIYWAFSFFNLSDTASVAPEFPQPNPPESFIIYWLSILFPFKYMALNIFVWGGMVFSFKRMYLKHYLFLAFLIPYFFFLCSSKSIEHIYPRYILPLTPILSIYGGIFIDYLSEKSVKRPYIKIIILALIIAAIFPVIKDTIALDEDFTKLDTRTIAKVWVEENIPNDSIIIIQGSLYKASTLTVPLKIKADVVDQIMSEYISKNEKSGEKGRFYEILKKSLNTQKTYHLILTGNNQQLLGALNKGTINYIILRDKTKRLLMLETNREIFPELYGLTVWLDSDDFELIKIFEPTKKIVGPKLLIYKRSTKSSTLNEKSVFKNNQPKQPNKPK